MSQTPEEAELLQVAIMAAQLAGAELLLRFEGDPVDVRTKSTETDPVSAADLAAEAAIRGLLARERPGDAILGEEGGLTLAARDGEPTGLRWVVDPLDGTVNYLYGIPQFAVSVGVDLAGETLVGVVLNPVSEELFTATRAGGARLNGEPISASPAERLDRSLVATGFGYDAGVRAIQGEVVARLLPLVRDVRRAGAAALDLCSVACGRVDAYFERGVKPWDIAAGSLFCELSGLALRQLEPVGADGIRAGSAALPDGLVVAAPAVIDELYALVS